MSTLHIIINSFSIFLILASSSHAKLSNDSHSCPRDRPIRAAYYPSWNSDTFPPSSIDTQFFTHVYYSFLNPNNITFKFEIDSTTSHLLKTFTSTLHKKNPPVKTLFSIGGSGDETTRTLSNMASSKSSRSTFIASTINVSNSFDFDGFDLDWEFPMNATEMNNLARLLEEWREASGNKFLITAAVYYSADTFLDGAGQRAYPVNSIKKNVDWLNVMSYDYRGSWDTAFTGAHAALYDRKTNLSTNFGMGRWIRVGLPRCKLVMGIPMYGRTWKVKTTESHGIGAPAVGVGPGGDGTMTYAEVVEFNKENNVKGVFDPDTVSVYSYSEKANNSWIGYDDPRSVAMKVSYAEAVGLGGYMFWEITGDYNWTISKRASDLIHLLNQTPNSHSKTG